MNKYVFLERGNNYNQAEANFTVKEKLDKGIYNTCFNAFTNEIYLEKIGNAFTFPFKLYGVNSKIVNSVMNYANATQGGNLGVLLNGTRGTGKTVTAKVIANKLNLPVIVISNKLPGLNDFIAKVQEDCIFFFDEFEKNFRGGDDDGNNKTGEGLLSVMDGVYNSDFRHVFLLTTNSLRINENFLSRPSRIRYRHTFGNVLDEDVLNDLLDDLLEDQTKRTETIKFINTLQLATIDIVKSVIEEINIQKCAPFDLKDIFNVDTTSFSIYYDSKTLFKGEPEYNTFTFDQFDEICNGSWEERRKNRIDTDWTQIEESSKSLAIGDSFDGCEITAIDPLRHFLVTEDDARQRKFFIKITNEHRAGEVNYRAI